MVHELRRQPFKGIYLALQSLATYLVRLPYWYLTSLPRFLRPRPSWSAFKTRLIPYARLYSEFGPIVERVGPIHYWPDYRAIPDIPGIKSIWLDATPELILGDVKQLADNAGVQAARIPGYWIDKEGHDTPIGDKPAAGEKVVYYIHGGGFIAESAHPTNMMAKVPRTILRHSSAAKRAFSVEYRLCALSPQPTNPFPAALIDAVAGYHYLIDVVGFSPESIILAGDSAGGAIALALARYLVDNIAELSARTSLPPSPPSYSMILLSPWCDLGTSHETPGSAALTFTEDFLGDPRSGLLYAARRAYAGPLWPAGAETNPYLSPASRHPDMDGKALFAGFPRTFIDAGGAERFLDMCRTLAARMEREMGAEKVRYLESADATHGHLHWDVEEPQNTEMMKAIEAWLADEGKSGGVDA